MCLRMACLYLVLRCDSSIQAKIWTLFNLQHYEKNTQAADHLKSQHVILKNSKELQTYQIRASDHSNLDSQEKTKIIKKKDTHTELTYVKSTKMTERIRAYEYIIVEP